MSKHILFTGGGSAGHVTVNLALIPKFVKLGWKVTYMGSTKGIEAELIQKLDQVDYIGISTGKLRRYMDVENLKDPLRVIKGSIQAYRAIRGLKPDIVFSKGGFVSVPVVLGAWLNRVPVIIHESDITPGLANRIAMPFASKICTTFPETKDHVNGEKAVHVGAVIREELLQGNKTRGLGVCDFTRNKPVLVCVGGSLGSQRINEMLRRNLPQLVQQYQVIHICGKGQLDPSYTYREYKQFEYVHHELPDLYAIADLMISRAGSNSIFEFLALKKPMLLIPLSKDASRGDQILNARSFQSMGYGEVLYEEDLNDGLFVDAIHRIYERRAEIISNMKGNENGLSKVVALIQAMSK